MSRRHCHNCPVDDPPLPLIPRPPMSADVATIINLLLEAANASMPDVSLDPTEKNSGIPKPILDSYLERLCE